MRCLQRPAAAVLKCAACGVAAAAERPAAAAAVLAAAAAHSTLPAENGVLVGIRVLNIWALQEHIIKRISLQATS